MLIPIILRQIYTSAVLIAVIVVLAASKQTKNTQQPTNKYTYEHMKQIGMIWMVLSRRLVEIQSYEYVGS